MRTDNRINSVRENTQLDFEQAFPLTDLQYAYWIGRRHDQPLGGVGCHIYFEMDGKNTDPLLLENSWYKVQQKHPMLRACIGQDGMQRIKDTVYRHDITVNDLRGMNSGECSSELLKVRSKMQERLLDIENGQMADMEISLINDIERRIHFDIEAIACDMFSFTAILNDLKYYYENPDAEVIPDDFDFVSYYRGKEPSEESEKFWMEMLGNLPKAPELPITEDDFYIKSSFKRREIFLTKQEWENFKENSMKYMVTPAMFLLAIYTKVLAKWSTAKDFLINMTVHEKEQELDERSVVADFTDVLLLPVRAAGSEQLDVLAENVQNDFFDLMQYADYSGVRVQRELLKRNPQQKFAAPIVFTCGYGMPFISQEVMDVFGEMNYFVSQVPQVWLELQAFEIKDGFLIGWESMDEIFPEGLIDEMFRLFSDMVRKFSVQDVDVSEIICNCPEEQIAEREKFIKTADIDKHIALHSGLLRYYAETPDAIAVIEGTNNKEYTYREFGELALKTASMLLNAGVKMGDDVAVSLPRGINQMAAVYGILLVGAAYIPISMSQPTERRNRIFSQSKCRYFLVEEGADDLLEIPSDITVLNMGSIGSFPPADPISLCCEGGERKAYTIFTSGSTGIPKGVEISHISAMNTIQAVNKKYSLNESDRIMAVSSFDFDLSVYDLFGGALAGGSVVLLKDEERRDAAVWCDLMKQYHITIWNSVPVLLDMLLVECESREMHIPSLRLALISGDRIPLKLPERFYGVTNDSQFVSLGGATEGAIWSNYYNVELPLDEDWMSIPYGYPLENQKYKVVDADGCDCPDWVKGELMIGGMGVALGYCGDPVLTSEKFRDIEGERWYCTGDLGRYRPGGIIEFIGRKDHQVKLRGHRIELGEIEAVALGYPKMDNAVAVLKTDKNGTGFIALYYVSAKEDIDEREYEKFIAKGLPEYMVPSVFVRLNEMPLTDNGKVDRKRLPDVSRLAEAPEKKESPTTETERKIAQIWKELLKIQEINRNDDYFVLGGDSLTATRLNARIRELFGFDPGLEAIFSNAQLSKLAEVIDQMAAQQNRFQTYPVIESSGSPVGKSFPLTEIQKAYYLGRNNAYALGNIGVHFYSEYETENIDSKRLEEAWNRVVSRHDMLRTVILENGEEQITLPDDKFYRIEVIDLSTSDISTLVAEEEKLRKVMSNEIFDVHQWPLFDIRMVQLPNNKQHIFVSFDSIILDGWSMVRFLHEWTVFYNGKGSELPELSVTFRDYVLELEKLKNSSLFRQDKEYWENRLLDIEPAPEIIPAQIPEEIKNQTYRHLEERLDKDRWNRLKHRAKEMSITPTALLLTAYSMILRRFSSRKAFTINLTHFNRYPLHPQISELIGDFTSLTLLSMDFTNVQDFSVQCTKVQKQLWMDLDHSMFCGVLVRRELMRKDRERYSAGFPFVFTSGLGMNEGSENDSMFRRIRGVTQTPQVWLDHQVMEDRGELLFAWDAVEEIFPEGMLDRMFEAYCDLLIRLADDANCWRTKIDKIVHISGTEKRELMNDTFVIRRKETLYSMFAESAAKYPDNIALCYQDTQITYRELAIIAENTAYQLEKTGFVANDTVAIIMNKSWKQIAAVLGILRAGGTYLPIDVSNPDERTAAILKNNVKAVLTDSISSGKKILKDYCVIILDEDIRRQGENKPSPVKTAPEDTAYIIYTSGSTGTPKGVMISHEGAVNTIRDINRRFDVKEKDKVIALSHLNFDLSVYDIFGMLAVGGTVVIPEAERENEVEHWIELINKNHVTIWNSVPALMKLFISGSENQKYCGSIRLALLSGDWIPVDIPEILHNRLGISEVIALGGATEASIWSNYYICEDACAKRKSIPYGRPLENQRYYVLDENLEDCPEWVSGELYIGGTGLAKGYYRDAELTSAKFITHPKNGERIYRTGDLGRYMSDGNIEFLGRVDSQVKVNGYRIETGEIECALKKLPGIENVVVTAAKGRYGNILVAYAVTEIEYSRDELADMLRRYIPEYMIPRYYIYLDEIPLTANGKIAYKALPVPDDMDLIEYKAAETAYEKYVERQFKTIFGIENPGIKAEFFELGGDSLQAIRIASAIRTDFSIPFKLEDVLKNSSVEKLADAIETAVNKEKTDKLSLPQIVPDPVNSEKPFPLTDIQQAYWIGRRGVYALGNVSTKYYFEIEGEDLDIHNLTEAWNKVIDRHGMMRTVIAENGEYQKTLSSVPRYEISCTDASAFSETEQCKVVEGIRSELTKKEFDISVWPLFEVRAVILPERRTRLHLCFDNITFDGFSMTQFLEEWAENYYNPEKVFSVPQITFRDYRMTLEKVKRTDAYKADASYWLERTDDIFTAPELPLKQKPEQITEQKFTHREGILESAEWEMLKKKAKLNGITVSGVLLAAYSEILSVWSRKSKFTLNLTQFNRLPLHPQIDELTGDFTSVILFALDHSQGQNFAEHCKNVQNRLWEDMSHHLFSGVQVQREMVHKNSEKYRDGFPVIFTSALGTQKKGGNYSLGKRVYGSSQTSQVWLDHQIMEENGCLLFSWDSVDELFPDGMLDEMFESYLDLLHRLCTDDKAWSCSRRMLVKIPNMEVREQCNKTYVERNSDTLLTLFENGLKISASRPAVITDNICLTYKQVDNLSDITAVTLLEFGIKKGEPVAVIMRKGFEQPVAALGVMKAGGAYIPIDVEQPIERTRKIMEEGRIRFAVTTESQLGTVKELGDDIVVITVNEEGAGSEVSAETKGMLKNLKPDENDNAYIIYTSGSTGIPKGVVISHKGAVNTIKDINTRFSITKEDCAIGLSNFNFDLSVYDMFGMFAEGAVLGLPDPDKLRDPEYWSEFMVRNKVTVWNSVPAFMQMLLETDIHEFSSVRLRLVLLSGDWISSDLPRAIKKVFNHVVVAGLGGATEASVWSNYYICDGSETKYPFVPYGYPLENQRYYIIGENGGHCPSWTVGNLAIGGTGVAKGYFNSEALTAKQFRYSDAAGERVYFTGDVARYLPDGCIEFLGREDEQVKINGYRIEMGEIEENIKALRGVAQAVVTAQEDDGVKKLISFVVPTGKNKYRETGSAVASSSSDVEMSLETGGYMNNLNTATDYVIYKVLEEMGLRSLDGKTLRCEESIQQLGIDPKFVGLYRHWVNRMTKDGYAEQITDNVYYYSFPEDRPFEKMLDDSEESEMVHRIAELFRREIPVYKSLLHGEKNILELYIDNDSLILPSVLKQFIGETEHDSGNGKKLFEEFMDRRSSAHVLEIGTRVDSILEQVLNGLSDGVQYTYIDESVYFLEEIEEKINGKTDGVHFVQADIRSDTLPDELIPHSYNLVAASNALHRFDDIPKLLRCIGRMMAEGGVLLFTENTVNHSSVINTVGLLEEGFSHYTDERRLSHLPLHDKTKWAEILKATGFNIIHMLEDENKSIAVLAQFEGSSSELTPSYIEEQLRDKLPKYMIPSKVVIVDELPLTANGKIDFKKLSAFAKEIISHNAEKKGDIPVEDTDKKLAEIWKDILKVQNVYCQSDFFELGGDSLTAIGCVNRIKKEFGANLSLKEFFEARELKNISEKIKEVMEEYEENTI